MIDVLVNFEIECVATHPGSRTRSTLCSSVIQKAHPLPAIPRPDDILIWKGLQFRVTHAPDLFNLDNDTLTITALRTYTFQEWLDKDKAEALQKFEAAVNKLKGTP